MASSIIKCTLVTSALLLSACSQPSAPSLPKSESFKAGEKDGCSTAHGTYTKDSERFRSDSDYHDGWFEGRKVCNPSYHKA